MKREGKKVSEFPAATSFTGLWTLGVDSASRSVKVSLDFIKSGYDAVVVATSRAVTATTNAKTATSQAVAAKNAANTAATAANNAKTSAIAATVAANALVGGMNASLADKITPAELTTALATKAALIPHSLAEQIVPGEFWRDINGISRQVYVRTFVGTVPADAPSSGSGQILSYYFSLASGFNTQRGDVKLIMGIIGVSKAMFGLVPNAQKWDVSNSTNGIICWLGSANGLALQKYSITVQYTKI